MKKIILSVSLLLLGFCFQASAVISGYIWALDVNNTVACFPANAFGQVARVSVSVSSSNCVNSYAWARDINNVIQCFPVGVNGRVLENSMSVEMNNCATAFIRGLDVNGLVRCFGQGTDGNILPYSLSVEDSNCGVPYKVTADKVIPDKPIPVPLPKVNQVPKVN